MYSVSSTQARAPRSWVTVDLEALCNNFKYLTSVSQTSAFGIVKADSYGHGSLAVVSALLTRSPCRRFAVATPEEGVSIREFIRNRFPDRDSSIEILILGSILPGDEDLFTRFQLSPALVDQRHVSGSVLEALPTVHMKINTGMNRLGIRWDDEEAIQSVLTDHQGKVSSIYSHFHSADVDDGTAASQIERFEHIKSMALRTMHAGACERADTTTTSFHLSNSAGLNRVYAGDNSDNSPRSYDDIRPGISLYGVAGAYDWAPGDPMASSTDPAACRTVFEITRDPGTGKREYPRIPGMNRVVIPEVYRSLKLPMKWMSRIVQIHPNVPVGETVGYCATWTARRPSRIAVLGIGYADGYKRFMSNAGWVIIKDKWIVPVIGRVSMDLVTVDITDLPCAIDTAVGVRAYSNEDPSGTAAAALEDLNTVHIGEPVVVMDNDPDSPCSVYQLAEQCKTIPYEIFTSISPRSARVYTN